MHARLSKGEIFTYLESIVEADLDRNERASTFDPASHNSCHDNICMLVLKSVLVELVRRLQNIVISHHEKRSCILRDLLEPKG